MDVAGFAVITGGGSGIGRACAQTFARDGAAGIALIDVSEQGLMETQTLLEKAKHTSSSGLPLRIIWHVVNVTAEEQVNTALAAVAKEFGRIDYVVNAAGIAFKHVGGAAYAETKDWQRVMDVNVNGTFYVLKSAIQIMLKQEPILSAVDRRPLQRGSIVNFGSIQSSIATPTSTSYVASKHAIVGLTKTASEDYAKDGIRVNAICPGYTETPLTMKNDKVRVVMEEKIATSVPMMRAARPSEIADGVIYLCGGRSSFVTGTSLYVDGGYTQR